MTPRLLPRIPLNSDDAQNTTCPAATEVSEHKQPDQKKRVQSDDSALESIEEGA